LAGTKISVYAVKQNIPHKGKEKNLEKKDFDEPKI
jgi:hypothetical protein